MRSLIFQHLLTLFGRWYCMDMCTITLHSVYIHPPLAASFFMHCIKNRGGRWPRFATERSVKKHYILLFCQNMESPFSTVCRATLREVGTSVHMPIWKVSYYMLKFDTPLQSVVFGGFNLYTACFHSYWHHRARVSSSSCFLLFRSPPGWGTTS